MTLIVISAKRDIPKSNILENITSILQDVDIIMDEHGDRCVTYSRT